MAIMWDAGVGKFDAVLGDGYRVYVRAQVCNLLQYCDNGTLAVADTLDLHVSPPASACLT